MRNVRVIITLQKIAIPAAHASGNTLIGDRCDMIKTNYTQQYF